MATRRETQRRCEALKDSLREASLNGKMLPGQMLPSVRELADEFDLSVNLVCRALQDLVTEGVLQTVPRVGTFVRGVHAASNRFYLMLLPDEHGITDEYLIRQIQTGFEGRIAQRGGSSLAMTLSQALQARENGALPGVCGIFDFAYHAEDALSWGKTIGLPRVGFSGRIEPGCESDEVSYDDLEAGRMATQHLLHMGHRCIAFIGVHDPADVGEYVWSAQREDGWRQALKIAGLEVKGLAFHPEHSPQKRMEKVRDVGRELAPFVLRRPDITAVVAANDHVVTGIMEAAREMQLSPERWPSMVGFDNLPTANGHVVTSLRHSGEDLGRAAADLLWERQHGLISGPPQHRKVPMHLISRLTSRMDWSLEAGHLTLATPPIVMT